MKIGIITIATGKYSIYVPDLVQTCEEFFLKNYEKTYYVYTDSEISAFKGAEKVIKIEQEKLGWPYDSMLRFHMFTEFSEILLENDYIFFMNANMKIVSEVDPSILPEENSCGIVATLHPGYYEKSDLPYENNTRSEFYVPLNKRNLYFQGCFNGGITSKFLEMSKILKDKMDIDMKNNIIPIWHDETAMNWYLVEKKPKILPPIYAYPEYCDGETIKKSLIEKNENSDLINLQSDFKEAENKQDPFIHLVQIFGEPKIIQRNKNKDGGKIYLRK